MVSSDQLRIRKAQETDLPAITDIYNDAIKHGTATFDTEEKTPENRRQWLEQHSQKYPVVVALLNETVVGWASLSRWSERAAYDDTAEISVYIHRDFRGRGIGRQLMQQVLDEGRQGGLHTVISRITQGNEISIHLHTQMGFETVGVLRQVGKKFGQLLDVTLMQKMY
ncbi:MAG: GNAT family N-acetyltransferase [Bacteroidia bacterium]|nr:GNAT family N-acetyltransferase [Bacteroidia bacterium]